MLKSGQGGKCLAAVVQTCFTEGICPDLMNVVEWDDDDDDDDGETVVEYSSCDIQECPDSQEVFTKSPVHRLREKSVERHSSSGSSSVFSPNSLDSPDSAFKTPKHSKLGVFSFLPANIRRCSMPVKPASRGCQFKTDLLAIDKHGSRKRSLACPSPISIIVSSAGNEGPTRLRRSREFGSTGDLLEGSTEFKPNSLRKSFGGSLEQVSAKLCYTV